MTNHPPSFPPTALHPSIHPTCADEALVGLWLTTVGLLAKSLCKDACQPLRDNALMVLSRALVASEQLHLPPELWVQTLREMLVPVVSGTLLDQGTACMPGRLLAAAAPSCPGAPGDQPASP